MAKHKNTSTTYETKNAHLEGDQAYDSDPVNKEAVVANPNAESIPEVTPYAEDPLVPMWWVRAFGPDVPYEPTPEPEVAVAEGYIAPPEATQADTYKD